MRLAIGSREGCQQRHSSRYDLVKESLKREAQRLRFGAAFADFSRATLVAQEPFVSKRGKPTTWYDSC